VAVKVNEGTGVFVSVMVRLGVTVISGDAVCVGTAVEVLAASVGADVAEAGAIVAARVVADGSTVGDGGTGEAVAEFVGSSVGSTLAVSVGS
jgi:hypothetical protein